MVAFVYFKHLAPGAKARVFMAESMNAAAKVPGLPTWQWQGVTATFRPTEHRCIMVSDPDLCTPGVLAQLGRLIASKYPGAELKIDASWERKCWDVWVLIPKAAKNE